MAFKAGETGNRYGRPAGIHNKVTTEFKEALNNLLECCSPKILHWLELVAAEDPSKALDHLGKLAEYVHPKLARTELTAAGGKDLFPKSIKLEGVKAERHSINQDP